MRSFGEALRDVEAREQTLEVYTDDDELVTALEAQFATRTVTVVRHPLVGEPPGFILIRDSDDDFQGALGLEQFERLVEATTAPGRGREGGRLGGELEPLFSFFEETLFTSGDRGQLLAISREIEDRAWRTGSGTILAGFQRRSAFLPQFDVYDRLAADTDLDVAVYVADDWSEGELSDETGSRGGRGVGERAFTVHDEMGVPIGDYWFVLFDGGPGGEQACGLLAEERRAQYYGFWTDDPATVAELIGVVRSLEAV